MSGGRKKTVPKRRGSVPSKVDPVFDNAIAAIVGAPIPVEDVHTASRLRWANCEVREFIRYPGGGSGVPEDDPTKPSWPTGMQDAIPVRDPNSGDLVGMQRLPIVFRRPDAEVTVPRSAVKGARAAAARAAADGAAARAPSKACDSVGGKIASHHPDVTVLGTVTQHQAWLKAWKRERVRQLLSDLSQPKTRKNVAHPLRLMALQALKTPSEAAAGSLNLFRQLTLPERKALFDRDVIGPGLMSESELGEIDAAITSEYKALLIGRKASNVGCTCAYLPGLDVLKLPLKRIKAALQQAGVPVADGASKTTLQLQLLQESRRRAGCMRHAPLPGGDSETVAAAAAAVASEGSAAAGGAVVAGGTSSPATASAPASLSAGSGSASEASASALFSPEEAGTAGSDGSKPGQVSLYLQPHATCTVSRHGAADEPLSRARTRGAELEKVVAEDQVAFFASLRAAAMVQAIASASPSSSSAASPLAPGSAEGTATALASVDKSVDIDASPQASQQRQAITSASSSVSDGAPVVAPVADEPMASDASGRNNSTSSNCNTVVTAVPPSSPPPPSSSGFTASSLWISPRAAAASAAQAAASSKAPSPAAAAAMPVAAAATVVVSAAAPAPPSSSSCAATPSPSSSQQPTMPPSSANSTAATTGGSTGRSSLGGRNPPLLPPQPTLCPCEESGVGCHWGTCYCCQDCCALRPARDPTSAVSDPEADMYRGMILMLLRAGCGPEATERLLLLTSDAGASAAAGSAESAGSSHSSLESVGLTSPSAKGSSPPSSSGGSSNSSSCSRRKSGSAAPRLVYKSCMFVHPAAVPYAWELLKRAGMGVDGGEDYAGEDAAADVTAASPASSTASGSASTAASPAGASSSNSSSSSGMPAVCDDTLAAMRRMVAAEAAKAASLPASSASAFPLAGVSAPPSSSASADNSTAATTTSAFSSLLTSLRAFESLFGEMRAAATEDDDEELQGQAEAMVVEAAEEGGEEGLGASLLRAAVESNAVTVSGGGDSDVMMMGVSADADEEAANAEFLQALAQVQAQHGGGGGGGRGGSGSAPLFGTAAPSLDAQPSPAGLVTSSGAGGPEGGSVGKGKKRARPNSGTSAAAPAPAAASGKKPKGSSPASTASAARDAKMQEGEDGEGDVSNAAFTTYGHHVPLHPRALSEDEDEEDSEDEGGADGTDGIDSDDDDDEELDEEEEEAALAALLEGADDELVCQLDELLSTIGVSLSSLPVAVVAMFLQRKLNAAQFGQLLKDAIAEAEGEEGDDDDSEGGSESEEEQEPSPVRPGGGAKRKRPATDGDGDLNPRRKANSSANGSGSGATKGQKAVGSAPSSGSASSTSSVDLSDDAAHNGRPAKRSKPAAAPPAVGTPSTGLSLPSVTGNKSGDDGAILIGSGLVAPDTPGPSARQQPVQMPSFVQL